MKLTWHIVRKDVHRMAWLMVAWLALRVATFALPLASPGEEGAGLLGGDYVPTLNYLCVITGLVVVYFFAGTMMQEDPVSGSNAFWVTRPISGWRLLGAKALALAGLFGVLPVLVTLPWWLVNGYGPRELGWAALETVAVMATITLPAIVVAAVTEDVAQFYRVTFFTVLLQVLAWASTAMLASRSVEIFRPVDVSPVGFGSTAWWSLAILLAAVAHQFLTRRRRRTLAIVGVSLAVGVVELTVWPNRVRTMKPVMETAVTKAVQLHTGRLVETAEPYEPAAVSIVSPCPRLEFAVQGNAAGTVVTVQSLRWATPNATGTATNALDVWGEDRQLQAITSRLATAKTEADRTRLASVVELGLVVAEPERLRALPAGVRLEADCRLWKIERVLTVPLRAGQTTRQGSYSLRIDGIGDQILRDATGRPLPGEKDRVVYLRETVPLLLADGASGALQGNARIDQRREIYRVVNRVRGENLIGRDPDGSTIRTATVGRRQVQLWLGSEMLTRDETAAREWLAGAELVKVVFTKVGEFSRTVDAPTGK